MKRNRPRQQRHERTLKRKRLKDAYSGKWFSVRARGISDTVAATYFDALSDIAGLTRRALAGFLTRLE